MRVILFILGLLFSADGLYFASTTSMGVGEAFTVAIGIMFILWVRFTTRSKQKAFEIYKRFVYVRNDCTCDLFWNYMRCRKKVTMRHTEKII